MNKGAQELSWFNWLKGEVKKYITYISVLTGALVGVRLIPFLPPEMYDRMFEWFPWLGEWMLWLSDNLTKEMIFYIMAVYFMGEVAMGIFRYFLGGGFDKIGFEKAEQLANSRQYRYFEMEDIVKPLVRIEKRLKTKEQKPD